MSARRSVRIVTATSERPGVMTGKEIPGVTRISVEIGVDMLVHASIEVLPSAVDVRADALIATVCPACRQVVEDRPDLKQREGL